MKKKIPAKYKYILTAIPVLFVLFFSCEKSVKKDIKAKNYILAGETDKADFVQINDSIIASYGEKVYSLDVNDDLINDFEFKSNITWYFGGGMVQSWSTVKAINGTEIMVDSTIKQIGKYIYEMIPEYPYSPDIDIISYSSKEITPEMINENDTIGNQGVWLTDTILKFCFSFDCLLRDYPQLKYQKNIFNGWNDLENKYIGFRITNINDTIYGWLNIEINYFYQIKIINAAYR